MTSEIHEKDGRLLFLKFIISIFSQLSIEGKRHNNSIPFRKIFALIAMGQYPFLSINKK